MSNRVFYYDALRAISIIGIVFCHVGIFFLSQGVNNPYFPVTAFFDCFREFSIPIFVMLSGALLINRRESLTKFFKKRLSRLLIPFFFWVLIYIAYSVVFIDHGFNLKNAVDIFFGTSGTLGVLFWFIWMIVICYLGIFAINKIIEYGSKNWQNFDKKFILALIILSVIYIALSEFGLFDPYSSKPLYFISFMTYIVIGYFIANNDYLGDKLSSKVVVVLALIASIALYSYYVFGFVVPQSLLNNHFAYKSYFNLLILALSVSVFVFFKYLSKTKYLEAIEQNNLGSALTLISKYSYGIYLCHYVVIFSLKRNFTRFFLDMNFIISIPFMVICSLVISIVILWALDKIPVLNKFSGIN